MIRLLIVCVNCMAPYFLIILMISCFSTKSENTDQSRLFAPQKHKDLLYQRCSTVTEALNESNKDIPYKYRKQKYQKMKKSPIKFFRGTSHLFWMDILCPKGIFSTLQKHKNIYQRMKLFSNKNTLAWLLADMHIYNIGVFQNRVDNVVFDLNDFDEVVVGDYQLDIWRLAASLYLVDFKVNRDKNPHNDITLDDINNAVEIFTKTYLQVLFDNQISRPGKVIFDIDHTIFHDHKSKDGLNVIGRFLKKAIFKPNLKSKYLNKWTFLDGNQRRFLLQKKNKKLADVTDIERQAITRSLYNEYIMNLKRKPKYFQLVDIARRLRAGIGSLGHDRYYALVKTKKNGGINDYIILDIKEQTLFPNAFPYLKYISPKLPEGHNRFASSGVRIISGHKGLANSVSNWAGYFNVSLNKKNKLFTVIDRNIYKDSFPIEKHIKTNHDLNQSAIIWGTLLGAAHSRSDRDYKKGTIKSSLNEAVKNLVETKEIDFVNLVKDVAYIFAVQAKEDYRIFSKACFNRKEIKEHCTCL